MSRRLVLIVAVALACRLLVFALLLPDVRKFYTADSPGYERLALNLLERGVFSWQDAAPWRPDAFRTPGYPVLLAGVYGLAGHAPAAVVALQLVLGSVTAGLAGVLALGLGFSARAAGLAALAVAVDPVSVLIANLVLTETLFTLLLTAGLAALAWSWQRGGAGWLGASGLALGLAALTRPILLIVLPVLGALFAVADRRAPWRAVLTRGVPFLLIPLVLAGAWAARNYREAGLFTPSAITSGMLLVVWAPAVVAEADGVPPAVAIERLRRESAARDAGLTLPERLASRREMALAILRRHPGATLRVFVKGLARLVADPGFTLVCTMLEPGRHLLECFPGPATMTEAGVIELALARAAAMTPGQQLALGWGVLFLGLLYLGAAAGVVVLVRERRWAALGLVVAVVGCLAALAAGPAAESRFRVPMLPCLALAAGLGWERWLGTRRARPFGAVP
jgi:hypothetical protein